MYWIFYTHIYLFSEIKGYTLISGKNVHCIHSVVVWFNGRCIINHENCVRITQVTRWLITIKFSQLMFSYILFHQIILSFKKRMKWMRVIVYVWMMICKCPTVFQFFLKSVALAGQCYHQPARFRHRNMYLIEMDHLPLGKVVISNLLGECVEHYIDSVLAHIIFFFPSFNIERVKTKWI